ncbi:hypothetical protein GCM10011507_29250 [Edaphobacter acidisoli]|uniref:Uncharacterized protein n=1 Tax=Edaphobacter acidisoli TaxID=2040573 RepID=A0A916S030_9BACT|nr:hypothetical protein [Edaphobacter acidisoli]GGA76025.1 hypothetical protein GCM10011507_29250 [Edaphobacter acidisoli]
MPSRFAAPFVLLVLCLVSLPQAPAQSGGVPRIYHDQSMGITYFYPQRFTPEQFTPAKLDSTQACVKSGLAGSSATPVGTSAFVVSSIGSTCPKVLQSAAANLDSFTREQVLRQLKRYGKPEVTRDATHYTIDGHPASITIAAVRHPAAVDVNSVAPPKMTYAAKACMLGEVPDKHSKASIAEQTKQIVCFDFTTAEKDLLPEMLAFTVQFDGGSLEPLVPGGILH